MMPSSSDDNKNVDIPQKAIENGFENAYSEVIRKEDLIPINDPNCQHRWQLEGHDAGMKGYVSWVCMDCPIGRMVKVGAQP